MATESIAPRSMHHFPRDNLSSTSNLSMYTSDAHYRLATGNFAYQNSSKHYNPSENGEKITKRVGLSLGAGPKKVKSIKEFPVSRKNSFRGPNYYRLSKSNVPTSKAKKRMSKFQKPEQIEPIIHSQNDVFENPNYMISYFTKNMELMKQQPRIFHQVLKTEVEKVEIADNNEITQDSKSRKYHSLPPIPTDALVKEKQNLRQQRQSAPPNLRVNYTPTNLTLSEYMMAPLDFYQYKKRESVTFSTVDTSSTNKTQGSSNEAKTKSTNSTNGSVATSALSANRSRLVETGGAKSRALQTKRKDSILRRQSVHGSNFGNDENFKLKQQISDIKKEKYLSKYGTPLLEASPIRIQLQSAEDVRKRYSDCGDVSIATGDEVYNEIKTEIFNSKPKNWRHAQRYIKAHYPEMLDNEYFITRFMFEMYLRRILAANMGLKIGSEKSSRSSNSAIWLGLRETIASVYGDDNALFFESQNARNA